MIPSKKIRQLWTLRGVIGILLIFWLPVCLFIWALKLYPIHVGIGAGLLIAVVVAMQPRIRRERNRIDGLVDAAFTEAYAPLSSPPALEKSSAYGYPAFKVIFPSKAELESAAPRNEMFKAAIDRIFQGFGSRRRPFSAQQAIYFTY